MAARNKMALVLFVAIQAVVVVCRRSTDDGESNSNDATSEEKVQGKTEQDGRRHITPQWHYDGISIDVQAPRMRVQRPKERAPAEQRIRAQAQISRVRAHAENAKFRAQAEMSRVRELAKNAKIRAQAEKTKTRLFGEGRRHMTPLWQYNGVANQLSRRRAHRPAQRSQDDENPQSTNRIANCDGQMAVGQKQWDRESVAKIIKPSSGSGYGSICCIQPERTGSQRRQQSHKALSPDSSDEAWSPEPIAPTAHTTTTTTTTTTPITTTTTTTPEPVFPPLDRRYRRIYNADETAKIEDYPFIAAILVNNELWCGGAIINGDSVLTAAHCLQLQYNNRFFREYVKMLSVRVGSSNATDGGEHYRVTELFFHPNYKPQSLEFNFALVKLNKNITFKDSKVQPISIARNKVVPIDKTVTFLGWGSVLGIGEAGGQVLLQKLDLPVYDLFDCQEIYGRELVTRSNFCAGYILTKKNVCNHDAGGPAIMDGVLTGVLSFSSKRCDDTDKPAVFSNTGHAAEWLDGISEGRSRVQKEPVSGWLNTLESKIYKK